MPLAIARSFYHRPSIASLHRPGINSSNRSSRKADFSWVSQAVDLNSHFFAFNIFPKSPVAQINSRVPYTSRAAAAKSAVQRTIWDEDIFWKSPVADVRSRALTTRPAAAKSAAQRTIWDEAAEAAFSESGDVDYRSTEKDPPDGTERRIDEFHDARMEHVKWKSRDSGKGSKGWEGRESDAGERIGKSTSNGGPRREGPRWREGAPSREFNGFSEGVRKWLPSANREYPRSEDRGPRDFDRNSKYGGVRIGTDQWQRSSRVSSPRAHDAYNSRSGRDSQNRWRANEGFKGKEDKAGRNERGDFEDDWRWQSREYNPPLAVKGESVYGVAPIVSALRVSRRKFYSLYMQENLLQNIEKGKRKDKAAVSFIEKTAKSMGVTVKEASKHDLNMLVDNRPHQGLVLDASPLELIPVAMLDPPLYQKGNKPPVWLALDEVTDPQNFGAILRSAYFLGAEGVVVCAKNSAPLSGVVSKASAGALEVMELQFCRNMVKFLDGSRGNGWRVIGASAESSAVPVREVPRKIATILVLGNEGRGLRTNVRRACDQLVSIPGSSNGFRPLTNDAMGGFVAQDSEVEAVGLGFEEEDPDEGEDLLGRNGPELDFISGPSAVDSLNVSVATGIMLYELLGDPTEGITVPS